LCFGGKKLNPLRVASVVIVVVLIISLFLNLYFYFFLRVGNENTENNMRARGLAAYANYIDDIEYFFKEYLGTRNSSLIGNEAMWLAYGAESAADVCRQGSNEEVYNQLYKTAQALYDFGRDSRGGIHINDTSLDAVVSSLDEIWRQFFGLEMVKDTNPLDYITRAYGANTIETVIYNCHIVQNTLFPNSHF
jgi:hypothetical protein